MSSKYSLPSAPLLLLVSDRTRYGERSLEDILVAALAGGVNMIELHEADMTARDLLGEAERLRKLALGGVPLVVYDRVDVAVAPVRLGAKSFDLRYRASVDGRSACDATITYVAVQPGANTSIEIPDMVRAALQAQLRR